MKYPLNDHLPTVPELQREVEALKNMNSKLQSDKFALEDTIRDLEAQLAACETAARDACLERDSNQVAIDEFVYENAKLQFDGSKALDLVGKQQRKLECFADKVAVRDSIVAKQATEIEELKRRLSAYENQGKS